MIHLVAWKKETENLNLDISNGVEGEELRIPRNRIFLLQISFLFFFLSFINSAVPLPRKCGKRERD